MQGSNQIHDWYAQLTKVSMDDKADLDVLLLDKKHPKDAIKAVEGLQTNLMQGTYKEDVLQLLLDCTGGDNAPSVQHQATLGVTQVCIIFDEQIKRSHLIQEAILEMLSYNREIVVSMLQKMYHVQQLLKDSNAPYDIRNSLIFHLSVVGQDDLSLFQ